jgi:GxxExxY protein
MTAPAENDPLTAKVIGFAIEIHRQLGPGLLESAYEECLSFELRQAGIVFERQTSVPVVYKSVRLDCAYRLDLMIENQLIVEIKSVERLMPIHEAQLITYLRLTGLPVGLLLNFNTDVLKNGIRRLVHPRRLTASL